MQNDMMGRTKQVNHKVRPLTRIATILVITIALLVVPTLPQISSTAFADTIVTVTINSASPTVIPLPGVRVGNSIFVQVFAHTIDPRGGGPLIVQSSGGYFRAFPFEQHISDHFIATKDDETISAFIQDANGDESATISLFLISTCGIKYDGATNCNDLDSGFDKTNPDAPWLSVAVGETTEVAHARISSVNPSDVTFRSEDTSVAQVLPVQASSSQQVLQVMGLFADDTKVRARINDQDSVCSVLNVAVFHRPIVKVAVHLITPKGCPAPNPGTNKSNLEVALNKIWDQAIVGFTVMKFKKKKVNYDLNGDCKLNTPESGESQELKAIVREAATDARKADINVFYVSHFEIDGVEKGGGTLPNSRVIFIQNRHLNTTENITAHEIGHALGLLSNVKDDITRLMYEDGLRSNPCFLNKPEWVITNAKASNIVDSRPISIVQGSSFMAVDRNKAETILSEIEQDDSTRLDDFLAIGSEAIPLLLERLTNKKPEIRENALDILGRIDLQDDNVLNQDQVVIAMLRAIDSSEPSRDVARTALRYLRKIDSNKVTPAMKQALLMQLQRGHLGAAWVMGEMGDTSFKPVLEAYLASHKNSDDVITAVLAKLGDQDRLAKIVAELDSEDVLVQLEAFEKLAYIRSRTTIRRIVQFLWNMHAPASTSSHVMYEPYRFLAADALSKIVDNPPVRRNLVVLYNDADIQLWRAWWQMHQHEYP